MVTPVLANPSLGGTGCVNCARPGLWGCRRATAGTSVIMKITNQPSESLGPPEPGSGRAAEGNCVVVRRGGKQLKADLWSQTRVNSIRPLQRASLLGIGEAWARKPDLYARDLPGSVKYGLCRGGWSGNAGKIRYVNGESCTGRNARRSICAAVRAAVGAEKSGNADGAKGGREAKPKRKT